ncbi:hypothetical protein Q5P01_025299 [Channa striata]|uniref:Uncharacterized protein n=1 Tax=Channa striata TaxID=64152 RepID=A0AA88LP21_CHASR|nr:hypothetical protein Q5P01_025299 [Channa striata]
MWDKRELLLAAIIFTAGYYIVTVMSIDLDMAEDAVDDRYDGCREKAMERSAQQPQLLLVFTVSSQCLH